MFKLKNIRLQPSKRLNLIRPLKIESKSFSKFLKVFPCTSFLLLLLLCSSNAVNYKIPKPLVLQFINKKERYIFTNLITYIRRYQNDLIAHRLQSKINSKEHTLGIVKWPVAEVFVLSWFQNLCSFRIRVVSHYISSFISPFLWWTAESSSLRLVSILPSISFFLLSLMFQQRDSIRECKDDYQGQIWGG